MVVLRVAGQAQCGIFFFFKQKTAYEVRVSDWSSDVCSSDLGCGDASAAGAEQVGAGAEHAAAGQRQCRERQVPDGLQQGLDADQAQHEVAFAHQIGRASCRERVCQYV